MLLSVRVLPKVLPEPKEIDIGGQIRSSRLRETPGVGRGCQSGQVCFLASNLMPGIFTELIG
jgi:hypothetical protein